MYVNNRDQGGNSTDILKLEQCFKVITLNAMPSCRNLARGFEDEWNNYCDFKFCSNYVLRLQDALQEMVGK